MRTRVRCAAPSLAERLGELEKGVTEGPWHFYAGLVDIPYEVTRREDAAFIARSRNLWPLLTEVVEALEWVKEETAQIGYRAEGDPFAAQGPTLTVSFDAYARVDTALGRLAAALDEET